MYAVVWDKALPYADYLRDKVINDHDLSEAEIIRVESIGDSAGVSFFGSAPLALLYIDETSLLKKTSDFIKKNGPGILEEQFPGGLVIVSTGNFNSTKALSKVVTSVGGESVLASSKPEDNISSLLSDMNVDSEVKGFLKAYAGEDYTKLVPIARSVKDFDSQITLENISMFFPGGPGVVAVWGVDEAVFSGSPKKALKVAHRVQSPMFVLAVLRKKIETLVAVYGFMSDNPRVTAETISSAIGQHKYPVSLAMNIVKKHSSKIMRASHVVSEYEQLMKGKSVVKTNELLDVMLVKLCLMFR